MSIGKKLYYGFSGVIALAFILAATRQEHVQDDRDDIHLGDPVLLIIEDDAHYARILLDLARGKGFKGVVANKGALGLSLARQYKPTAISLVTFSRCSLSMRVVRLKLSSRAA